MTTKQVELCIYGDGEPIHIGVVNVEIELPNDGKYISPSLVQFKTKQAVKAALPSILKSLADRWDNNNDRIQE